MGEEPDGELIQRSQEQPDHFEAIFDRHYDAVRMYAQRRAGHADGEEIAASTFEQAFQQRTRFDAERFSSARPWLIGIANNLIRHHVRQQDVRRRRRPLSIMLDATSPEPGLDAIEALERWPALKAALESLSESDRETFLLHVLTEMPYSDVAQVLGIPIGTVRSRINRARRVLRELITPAEAINPGEED